MFTVISEHICFLLLVFLFLHFLVVGSVRQIKLTHVGFRAHVKIASRIVSYVCRAVFLSGFHRLETAFVICYSMSTRL